MINLLIIDIEIVMSQNLQYKVVLIGDSSVGKSSILRRFTDDSFQQSYLATIGVDFKFKTLEFDDKAVKLQIWDTAGQERFRTITSAYYKNAQAIVLVFDLKVRKTFENLQQFWMDQIKKYSEKEVQIVVLANKMDCQDVEIQEEELAAFSLKHGIPCVRVSAKTGEGVGQGFNIAARNCVKTFGQVKAEEKNSVIDDIHEKKRKFEIRAGQQAKTQKKKCC